MHRTLASGSVAVAVALAGGCGGDEPAFDPGVPDLAYCQPVAGFTSTALEDEIVVIVNQRRAAGATCGGEAKPPVPALTVAPALRCAARVHSLDMVDRGYFDHTNPEGEAPWDRMVKAGYAWSTAGENIAAGNRTAAATMDQWMNSPGHCANIMNGDFVDIGVGHVEAGAMWTQVFGAPR
ncbi:MAG: CAP domain-containing protein [Kofleriaceae bacterium]